MLYEHVHELCLRDGSLAVAETSRTDWNPFDIVVEKTIMVVKIGSFESHRTIIAYSIDRSNLF